MTHIYNGKLNIYARQNRQAGILSEILLWNQLKKNQSGVKFTKQKPIGNYVVDFYCKECNLVIEIDGDSHNGKFEYDRVRDEYMAQQGIKVLRFWDTDILKNMEGVLLAIRETLPVGCAATPPKEGSDANFGN